jgi:CDP-diacylglycerol--serine O-phosphatidyltransferase
LNNELPDESQNETSKDSEAVPKETTLPEFSKGWKLFFTFLANFITFLNFSSGVIAIVLVSIDPRNVTYVMWAAKLILLAVIFDFTDGIPARLARKEAGFFGTIVDSIADTISFGIAPAVMISLSLPIFTPESTSHFALAICSIIIGLYFGFCTIFRLIRFTKSPSKKWFRGIPSPGAGNAAALYILLKLYIEIIVGSTSILTPIIGLVFMVFTGTMMIVKIKYPSTKLRKNPLEIILIVLAGLTIVTVVSVPLVFIIYPVAILACLTLLYFLYGPFYMLTHMMDRAKEVEKY